jgi:hypothetical protein
MAVSAPYGAAYIGTPPKTFTGGGLSDLARSCKCDDSLAVVVEYETEEGGTDL